MQPIRCQKASLRQDFFSRRYNPTYPIRTLNCRMKSTAPTVNRTSPQTPNNSIQEWWQFMFHFPRTRYRRELKSRTRCALRYPSKQLQTVCSTGLILVLPISLAFKSQKDCLSIPFIINNFAYWSAGHSREWRDTAKRATIKTQFLSEMLKCEKMRQDWYFVCLKADQWKLTSIISKKRTFPQFFLQRI